MPDENSVRVALLVMLALILLPTMIVKPELLKFLQDINAHLHHNIPEIFQSLLNLLR